MILSVTWETLIELLLQGNKKILDQQREPRTVWIYSKADFRKANHLISSTNWNALLYNNVSRSVEYWQEQFLYIMSICIPKRKLRKNHKPPWLPVRVVKLIKQRNSYFRRAKRTNDCTDWTRYRKFRNMVTKEVRLAKVNYYESVDTCNSKNFWKAYIQGC